MGKWRLANVLKAQIVCCERTLEQKICDAGPNPMRVEPMILSEARKQMMKAGEIIAERHGKLRWYYRKEEKKTEVESRLAQLVPLHLKTQEPMFKHRMGQMLEIAVLSAVKGSGMGFLGNFSDLGKHDDSTPYTKVEPPQDINGRKMEKGPLDFVIFPRGISAGVEVKNYRTWLYPDSTEVKELLWKCGDVGAVPILVARRLPFLTIRLLQMGGCLVHENYNQLYPKSEEKLAGEVRDKGMLGYHDVRTGGEPDRRMVRFFSELVPGLVEDAAPRFKKLQDVHRAFGKGEVKYYTWYREVRRGIKGWRGKGVGT